MAGKGVSYIRWKKTSGKCFMTALSSALLEWLLILMLLMNGLFAYLITCFARYCDLPLPCMLCSRLDHVFGSQRVGSCWDLMCKAHKSEISSLVMCSLHQKLVDVHGMCENCLFSFATNDKSNPETYRLLVGKLGIEPGDDVDDFPLLDDDHQKPVSSDPKLCCCCNEPWSFRSHAQVLVQKKSVEIQRDEVVDPDLTRELKFNWNSANIENKRPFFVAARSVLHESFEDCSPHFGYSELKLDSDSESDDHEIEELKKSVSETFNSQKHLAMDSLPIESQVSNVSLKSLNLIDHEESQSGLIKSEILTVPDSTMLETPNLIDDWMKPREDSTPEPSDMVDQKLSHSDLIDSNDTQSAVPGLMKSLEDAILEPTNLVDQTHSHSDLIESNEAPSALPTVSVGHGLEELNWQDIDLKIESSPQSDHISTDSVPESPNAEELQTDPSKDHVVQKHTETSVQVEKISGAESIETVKEPEKEQDEFRTLADHVVSDQRDTETSVQVEKLSGSESIETVKEPEKEQDEFCSIADHVVSGQKDYETSVQVKLTSRAESIESVKEPENEQDEFCTLADHVVSGQKHIETSVQVEQTSEAESIETVNEPEKELDVLNSEVNNGVSEGGVQVQVQVQPMNNLELSDAYKLAVSSRGRQLSGKTLEQFLGRDSTKVSEDLKLLLSQLSVARGLDLPLAGMISPRISTNLEESKALDSLALIGMQLLHRRISLERNDSRNSLDRNESGFESLDISAVSAVDGESELERLKRQIEHDKKFMNALYKELEEERNASAVAANQALAMITRLQEEKAALQMEALHDIRMMEDQAEYDVEALERANELLVEREKEIQDLEAELDYYRLKYPDDELMLENEEMILHQNQNSVLGFEDERLYISQRLSNLEKKLHLFSNTGIYPDLKNGDCFNIEEDKKDNHSVLLQTKNSASFGSRRSLVRRVNSIKTPRAVIGQDSLVNTGGDMASLGSEVSTLNERLQALEADRNFLEHAINSLRNGEEGVRFLREIASHLQELRRAGIKRKQSLA